MLHKLKMKYYNKINRNFLVKARLYYNENSHNRNLDSTPRFFIQVKSIDDPALLDL